jgi:hypothetical protein
VLLAGRQDIERTRADLEKWYADAMDRLSGYYKRWVKRILLVLAVIVVVAFNVNTIQIAQVLWREPAVRSGVLQQVTTSTTVPSASLPANQVKTGVNEAFNLPVGWSSANWHTDDGKWLWIVIGWLFSVGAISLGAPFWFDLLSRFNSLRSTGPPAPS